jgi:hypothetical protein
MKDDLRPPHRPRRLKIPSKVADPCTKALGEGAKTPKIDGFLGKNPRFEAKNRRFGAVSSQDDPGFFGKILLINQ